jgi:hypothetical protein
MVARTRYVLQNLLALFALICPAQLAMDIRYWLYLQRNRGWTNCTLWRGNVSGLLNLPDILS